MEMFKDLSAQTPVTGSGSHQLSTAKRQLLERWKKGHAQATGIPLRDAQGATVLSFAQERFWFLEQLRPGNTAYNLPSSIRIYGALHIPVLEYCLNEVICRHEILRTTFVEQDGVPVQLVQPPYRISLTPVALDTLSEEERSRCVLELASQELNRPFDLQEGHLLRAKLLTLGEQEYVLLLIFHHIIFDGWSNILLFKELSQLYRALLSVPLLNEINVSAQATTVLPRLSIQYADFAHWQRQQEQSQRIVQQLAYWQQQLADVPRCELPTDYARPAQSDMHGADIGLHLSQRLTDQLKALSRLEGVTPSTTLLAAFQLLLARYTAQTDIALGVPAAYRDRIETEPLLGLFLNTLILRTNLSGDPTFKELLQRVHGVTTSAYSNQDLPYEKLLETLHLERELSRNPLFDIMFNAISIPDSEQAFDVSGLSWEFFEHSDLMAKFPLTLYVYEKAGQLKLLAVYQKALFVPQRITLLLDQFNSLLEQIVSDPTLHLSAYTLATSQTRPLLPDPVQTLEQPVFQPCTEDILDWASRTPLQVAVRQHGQEWTYAQLVSASQRCAQALCSSGLQRGDVVALSGTASYGLIVGMVAILMSGGVLMTLDRQLPIARRLAMLEQAQARFLLTLSPVPAADKELLAFPFKQQILLEARTGQLHQAVPATETAVRVHAPLPDDPAYIFFTSGTTGMPKAVLGVHRSLSHFLHWQRTTFSIGSGDRHAQLTGLAFDVILRDVFLPLTSGATLCLPQEEWGRLSPEVLSWLVRENISVLHSVPSLARAWLAAPTPPSQMPALRLTFFAGEPLTETLVHDWRALLSKHGHIVNLYGPTETTLARCYYRVPEQAATGVQPVGQAIPQSQALVLTPQRQLCGLYEPGEIAIRTPFRTRGYLNREANAGRFIPNPFNPNDPQDLLYLTGDRGQYRHDGLLEILGRLDDQVKIRGIRVEPGEIASVLERHDAICSAFVLARSQDASEKYLVAYLVFDPAEACELEDVKTWLRRQLPEYMLPTEFVLLEQLPLTPNGKVDRAALSRQKGVRIASTSSHTPPANPLEHMVFQLWRELLPQREFGVTDNFFDIGGHSLLIIQLQSRLQTALHLRGEELLGHQDESFPPVTVTVVDIFQYSTIRSLALYIVSRFTGEARHSQTDQGQMQKRQAVRRQFGHLRTERRR